MSIHNKLESEILNELDILADMEVGSEQYETTINGLTKLLDRSIEMDKVLYEAEAEDKKQNFEEDLKLKELKHEKRDRFVKNVLTAISIGGGFALTVWGTLKSFKFEETGTVTTIMGRGFINNLLPKKQK